MPYWKFGTCTACGSATLTNEETCETKQMVPTRLPVRLKAAQARIDELTDERDKYKAALERINSWGCRYGDGYPNHCAVCVANVALNSEP